jgi:hypothetical protein
MASLEKFRKRVSINSKAALFGMAHPYYKGSGKAAKLTLARFGR